MAQQQSRDDEQRSPERAEGELAEDEERITLRRGGWHIEELHRVRW